MLSEYAYVLCNMHAVGTCVTRPTKHGTHYDYIALHAITRSVDPVERRKARSIGSCAPWWSACLDTGWQCRLSVAPQRFRHQSFWYRSANQLPATRPRSKSGCQTAPMGTVTLAAKPSHVRPQHTFAPARQHRRPVALRYLWSAGAVWGDGVSGHWVGNKLLLRPSYVAFHEPTPILSTR